MILATPQGVGTVWHSQRAYTHRKAANGQSFYFNWGAHDLSLVFTCLLIQAFPKTIFYNSVSHILFIGRFCFFYWTLKLFWTPRLCQGGRETRKTHPIIWGVFYLRQLTAGATGRTRTDGLRITNALLYQLSHSSILIFQANLFYCIWLTYFLLYRTLSK